MTAGRWRRSTMAAVAALAVAAPTTAAAPSAGAAVTQAGGRVTLSPPTRVLDTRDGTQIAAGRTTNLALPANAVLTITILDEIGPGHASVGPCAPAPTAVQALALFDTDEAVANTVVTGPSDCLTSSVPVHVAVDQGGAVSTTASPAGSQYVPLPVPVDASPTAVVAGEDQFALPSVPGDAMGVVLGVSVAAVDEPGYVTLYPCGQNHLYSSLLAGPAPSGSVVVGALAGAPVQCIYASSPTVVQVSVLGYLQTSGPDPSRLPPTLRWNFGDVAPPGLAPVTPTRVLDTRESTGGGLPRKLEAGEVYVLDLAADVSLQTTAVVLNVTATEPDAAGYLTVFPCDADARPTASNLNYVRNQTVPNLVTVRLAFDATVCVYTQSRTHVVADLTGTYEFGAGLGAVAVTPDRLVDTREANLGAKVAAGRVLTVAVAGHGGVPASGARAATLNVTVTEPDAAGYATVYPCDVAVRPTASNLNFVAGQTVPNAVTVGLSTAGTVCVFTQSTVHLVVDVVAWFGATEPAGFEDVSPARVLDTRFGPAGGETPDGLLVTGALSASGPLAGGQPGGVAVREGAAVAGHVTVPATAVAVVLNVTVTNPQGNGFLTVYPCGGAAPRASNLNFAARQTVANQVSVALPASGAASDVCFASNQTTDVVVDLAGYYTEQPDKGWIPDVCSVGTVPCPDPVP